MTLPRMNSMRPPERDSTSVSRTIEEKIIEFLAANETITRADVEKLAGTSPSSAARILKKNVQHGELIRIGEGKNTKYRLVKA